MCLVFHYKAMIIDAILREVYGKNDKYNCRFALIMV